MVNLCDFAHSSLAVDLAYLMSEKFVSASSLKNLTTLNYFSVHGVVCRGECCTAVLFFVPT